MQYKALDTCVKGIGKIRYSSLMLSRQCLHGYAIKASYDVICMYSAAVQLCMLRHNTQSFKLLDAYHSCLQRAVGCRVTKLGTMRALPLPCAQ